MPEHGTPTIIIKGINLLVTQDPALLAEVRAGLRVDPLLDSLLFWEARQWQAEVAVLLVRLEVPLQLSSVLKEAA